MDFRTVPYASLRRNPAINARGDAKPGNIAGLIAQIRHNRSCDPLSVRAGDAPDIWEIFDGDRRHAAIGGLWEEGDWRADELVPVLDFGLITDARARELSIALNTERQGLTPIEEATAFAQLSEGGMTVETIAAHFAKPERHVRQRLALGRLPSEILEAARAGAIDLATAQAFTLAKDDRQQRKLFRELSKQAFFDAHSVKQAITGEKLDASGPRGKFIAAAYAVAGGPIVEDLFGEKQWFADAKLATKLFEQRLAETVEAYKADGWSEVTLDREGKKPTWNLTRTEPKGEPELDAGQSARIKELQAQIDKLMVKSNAADKAHDWRARRDIDDQCRPLRAELEALTAKHFTKGQKRHAGVLIIAGPDRFEILEGITKAGARSQVSGAKNSKTAPPDDPDDHDSDSSLTPDTRHLEPDFTGALKADLAQIMGGSLQMAIAEKPGQAQRLMTAALIIKKLSPWSTSAAFALAPKSYAAREVKAHDVFAAQLKAALAPFKPAGTDDDDDGFVDGMSLAAVLDQLDLLPEEERGNLFALLLADSLDWGMASPRDLVRRMDPEPQRWWQPDEAFFNRLNRAQLSAALSEAAVNHKSSAKKPDLVAIASRQLPPSGWLPDPLRAPNYAGPGSNAWAEAQATKAADKIAAE
jgi:ParB/RepB/Spo0J family partition protein